MDNDDFPDTNSDPTMAGHHPKFAVHHHNPRISSNVSGDIGSHHQINKRQSTSRLSFDESLHSFNLHGQSSRVRGLEYSNNEEYDPLLDILQAQKYAAEREDLKFRRIFRYAKCIDWLLMVFGLLLAIVGSLITPWLYYWGGVAIHDILVFERCNATVNDKKQPIIPHYFATTTLADVGFELFKKIVWGWFFYNLFQLGYCVCFTIAADRQTKAIRAAYFESVVRKDMAWFDLYADKDFGKEMTAHVTHIRLGIGDVIPNFVNLIFTVAAMIILVFLLNHQAALSFLCFIPICMLFVWMGNWAEKNRAAASDRMFEKANLIAKESLVNIKVIKMYEAEKKQAQRFGKALQDGNVDGRKKEIKWTVIAAISSGSIWLLLNVATSFVFWLGQGTRKSADEFCNEQRRFGLLSKYHFTQILLEGGLDLAGSPGEILLVYFGLMYITLHAMEVPNFLSLMHIAKLNAKSVFFIIDWKSRIDSTSNEGKSPKRSAVGRLDFNNVTFRYPQKPDETVLSIRQLTIYSGQYVAFAGPENSGKNTILKLIPRLYDTCSGFITLDAVNLQNYNIHWLRRQMCIISEVPVIFSGTITENILFGKLNANEEEIQKACELAEVHHVIANLPDGYHTKISSKDFGDHLTRDQKRQLCLARAYLHRSRLILLDNPVQPEDDELEPLLLKFVHHFRDTATVILASTTVTALSKRADCIYYMENGRILESGNHIQLIQARGRYYSRLEGTMNTSVESRNKFESQLKAFKYSQLLHKKRKSSTMPSQDWDDGDGDFGLGDTPSQHKRKLWSNFLKFIPFSGGKGRKGFESGDDEETERKSSNNPSAVEEGRGEEATRKKSILRKSQQQPDNVSKIYSLEESYNRYHHGIRNKSTDKAGYMHRGFGMMGFQRMNFARPMTNFSTQIHKQRHSFSSNFGNQPWNMLRGKRLSLPTTPLSDSLSLSIAGADNETDHTPRTGTHVRFSFIDPHDKAHEDTQSKSAVNKKGAPFKQKKIPVKKTSGIFKSNKNKKTTNKQGRGNASNHSLGKTPSKSTMKTKSITQLHQTKKRASVQDVLQGLTSPTSFHLNEHVEIDNVSILSEELDSFLAEYDEGVYSALTNDEKGFWRDIIFVAKHDWAFTLPAMIASFVLGISIPYQTWVIGTFFQTIGHDKYSNQISQEEVVLLTIYMLSIGVVTAVAAFLQEFLFAMAGRRMTRRLREKLFEHILKQDLAWFDDKAHDIGILIFQLYADVMIIHHILLMTYGILIQATCNVVTSIAVAAIETSDEYLISTVWFIAGMPFLIAIVYVSSQKELKETQHLEDRFKTPGNLAQEFLMNIKTWFSLGAETFFIAQHKKILDREYVFIKFSSIFTSFLHTIVQTSSWLLYGVFIYLTLTHVKEQKHVDSPRDHVMDHHPSPLTKPTLIGFIMIATELLVFGAYRVGDQIAVLTDVEFGKTAAHKIMRILVNEPETDPSSKVNTNASDEFDDEKFFEPPPEIGLTDITYYYPGTDQLLQDPPLHKISMTIASSSYVAIVGPPGSGKSTLCNIILRMCNPTAGILDFNGDDSFSLSPKVTRRLMGLVEYDPCLFDFSILENIRVGKYREVDEPNRVEVEEATKFSNCHYDILDLPQDYSTPVCAMERTAHNFSLKQRISFARALLRKPKILLVDDATTSVDTESDHKILEVISNVREGRTLVVFSHKIEPIRDADQIFVLWDGEIVESGTDSFLLSKKGYYYEMFMTQKVLQDSMRNSPQQLSTIRYNIKKIPKAGTLAPVDSKRKLAEMASKTKLPKRQSSIAFVKFLDEKVNIMKAEKAQIRQELDKELPELEMEEKERELAKSGGKRRKSK